MAVHTHPCEDGIVLRYPPGMLGSVYERELA